MSKPLYDVAKDFSRVTQIGGPSASYGSHTAKDYSRILHSQRTRRLQGKMQLFPIGESDVLRTRLTHSHEVADIATTIVDRINHIGDAYFRKHPIDRSLVAAISLAHDIGHPPFGHDGEYALNACMRSIDAGGFEGNAQTLRIVARLENRLTKHQTLEDLDELKHSPHGLNLTFRTLAGFIKKDKQISDFDIGEYNEGFVNEKIRDLAEKGQAFSPIDKGYYAEEADLVAKIKQSTIKGYTTGSKLELPTIECQIMDLADDIAYSTYDLEDAIVAGIVSPLALIGIDDEVAELVAKRVTLAINDEFDYTVTKDDVHSVLCYIFRGIFDAKNPDETGVISNDSVRARHAGSAFYASNAIVEDRAVRRLKTEQLINSAISAVTVKVDAQNPELSKVSLSCSKRIEIECLKAFNFQCVINSPNSRMHSQRGKRIVSFVFFTLLREAEHLIPGTPLTEKTQLEIGMLDSQLYPDHETTDRLKVAGSARELARYVCDYVAQMTDEEALSFYRKLSTTDRMLIHNLHFPMKD